MKGLYVYGALTIGLSFYVGVVAGNKYLMLAALVSAALAAFCEALIEVANNLGLTERSAVGVAAVFVAGLSWVATATAAALAAATLL